LLAAFHPFRQWMEVVKKFCPSLLIHWHNSSVPDSCCPGGIIIWSPAKSLSECSCFKWSLKGLITRTHSCELTSPDMTHFMNHRSDV
jgi:hypothetical protein